MFIVIKIIHCRSELDFLLIFVKEAVNITCTWGIKTAAESEMKYFKIYIHINQKLLHILVQKIICTPKISSKGHAGMTSGYVISVTVNKLTLFLSTSINKFVG